MSNNLVGAVRVLLSADTAQYTRGMRRAVRTSEQSAQRIQQVMRVAQAAIAALGAGIGVRSFVQAASAAEQYGVRLQVLLRSQSEANRLFREMTEFAGRVPFEFEEIMGAATQLAGVLRGGVNEVSAVMPMIGDLAATTGLSIQQTTEQVVRMFSAGAGAADLFRERGVLAMLGFQAGVSYSAEETRRILMDSWNRTDSQFRGATDRLAGTWSGLMSMMSDRWFMFRTRVMEAGLFEGLKNSARATLAFIDRNMEGVLRAIRGGIERIRVFAASWVEVLSQMNRNTDGLVADIAQRFSWLSQSILRHFIDRVIDGLTHLPTNIRAVFEVIIGIIDRFRLNASAAIQIVAVAFADSWGAILHSAEVLWLQIKRVFMRGVDSALEIAASLWTNAGAAAINAGFHSLGARLIQGGVAFQRYAGNADEVTAALERLSAEREIQAAQTLDQIRLIEVERRLAVAASEAATEAALAERDAIIARMNARIEEARNFRVPQSQGGTAPPLQETAEGVEKLEDQVQTTMEQISTYSEQAARSIQNVFADFLFDPFDEGLKGMLKGFIDVIRRMVAEAAAAQIFSGSGVDSFLGSILGGLGISNKITGKRAMGGPVAAGGTYLVGEKGPELFMPNMSGHIIPNGKGMGGGGLVINMTVSAERDPSRDIALAEGIAARVLNAVETNNRYGYYPA